MPEEPLEQPQAAPEGGGIDDYELEGFSGEAPEDDPRGAAEAAGEPGEPEAGGEQGAAPAAPDVDSLTRQRDEAHGRAVRHYRELQDARERLGQYEQVYGQLQQQQAQQGAQPEPPPEWDPDNPAPYLRYQVEQANSRAEALEQMLVGQQQQGAAERQQQALAQIDHEAAQETLRGLGMVQGAEPDPEFASAHRYVMARGAAELADAMGLPPIDLDNPVIPPEVAVALARRNQEWGIRMKLAGRSITNEIKAHARRIGWTAPPPAEGGEQQPAAQPQRPAAAAGGRPAPSTNVFRRPQAPRGNGGGQAVPKLTDFQSEDEFFAALDSGALERTDVANQLVVERPGVV